VEPLIAAGAQPGNEHVVAAFAGAAVVDLDGTPGGRIAVLVGEELTTALASSPLEGLDLAAATQPALDAAAAVVGGAAGPARTVELDLVVSDLGPAFTVVPLIGSGIAASVLIQDHLLDGVATSSGTEPLETDAAAPVTPAAAVVEAETASAAPAAAPTAPVAEPAGPGVAAMTAAAPVTALPRRGIEMLHGVDMEVTVELGRTRMTVRDLLALTPGAVLELDRAAGSPADLLVNGRLIARGEVVVVDEDFGLRVTEIVDDAAGA
jgi:flagellar motor switch protein FliN/FliY